jgi:hypothetical protein
VDMNYGLGRRIQLKFEMPWVALQTDDQTGETGAGNATVGVKWRFLGQEGDTIAWSVYPQLDFSMVHSTLTKGIEDHRREFLMPTEVTVEMFRLELNAEGGRTFTENARDRAHMRMRGYSSTSRVSSSLIERSGNGRIAREF